MPLRAGEGSGLDCSLGHGFVEGYDPEDPDAELHRACCHACDEVLVEEREWNDRSEAFAGIRVVCPACYRRMRALDRSDAPGCSEDFSERFGWSLREEDGGAVT